MRPLLIYLPSKTEFSLVLETQPGFMDQSIRHSNVRIIRQGYADALAKFKSGNWYFDLEPGYKMPELGRVIDRISKMDTEQAALCMAAMGYAPDFIFQFSEDNKLQLVLDAATGKTLYQAPAEK